MDETLRLQYLEAMGIEVWVSKAPVLPLAVLPTVSTEAASTVVPEFMPVAAHAELEAIATADDWQSLEHQVATCTQCGLCSTRNNTVFGAGNKTADWLFIGEAPGQHEDEQGLPFVGVAGQLLTEMIRAMGLSRAEVFITNIVKCRPPANRDPHVDEVARCHAYLQRQIALIQPKIIVAVGRIAAQTLLNTSAPLAKLRGKVHHLHNTPLVVVYHPAYLLRSLLEKRAAWQDLQFALRTAHQQEC